MVMTGCHERLEERCAREERLYKEILSCPGGKGDIIVDSTTSTLQVIHCGIIIRWQNRPDNAEGISKSKVNPA